MVGDLSWFLPFIGQPLGITVGWDTEWQDREKVSGRLCLSCWRLELLPRF